MFEYDYLDTLDSDPVRAAAAISGHFQKCDRKLKGKPEHAEHYLRAYGLLCAFMESRSLEGPTLSITGQNEEDIESVQSEFHDLVGRVRSLVNRSSAQKHKMAFLQRQSRAYAPTRQCLVIMPMGAGTTRYINDQRFLLLIKPGLEQAGFTCIRVDKESHAADIRERLIKMLYTADLVVADLTTHNPNVLYEIGFRHAIGKPCVQIAPEGEDIPFDVSGIQTILYKTDLSTFPETIGAIADIASRLPRPMTLYLSEEEARILEFVEDLAIDGELHKLHASLDVLGYARLSQQAQSRLAFTKSVIERLKGTSRPRSKVQHQHILTSHDADNQASILYELALEAYGFNDLKTATEVASQVAIDHEHSPLAAPARILLAMCHIISGHPERAESAMSPISGMRTTVGGYQAYIGLQEGIVHLALRQAKRAAASFDSIRTWRRSRNSPSNSGAAPQYPYAELTQIYDRKVLYAVTADRMPCDEDPNSPDPSLLQFITSPPANDLMGIARVTARNMRALRKSHVAMSTLTALSVTDGWPRKEDVLAARLDNFCQILFNHAG